MANKKTELIGVKCSKELKDRIQQEADKNEWTLSHMAEKILRDYFENKPD